MWLPCSRPRHVHEVLRLEQAQRLLALKERLCDRNRAVCHGAQLRCTPASEQCASQASALSRPATKPHSDAQLVQLAKALGDVWVGGHAVEASQNGRCSLLCALC